MRALVHAAKAGSLQAKIQVVVAPKPDSPALEVAQSLGVSTAVVPFEPPESYGSRLVEALNGCDWLCLAGFTRLVPTDVVDRFRGRALNIHPALLPKFGGRGMYGHHVHDAVLAAGEVESGCTVHWVTKEYDEGAVILQLRCPVRRDDTPDTLADRVLALEHQAFPAALQKVIDASASQS